MTRPPAKAQKKAYRTPAHGVAGQVGILNKATEQSVPPETAHATNAKREATGRKHVALKAILQQTKVISHVSQESSLW